ncbi:MAG: LysM peptidoglycan-binding domain-containing protein, partial [Solibacillus isronensis]
MWAIAQSYGTTVQSIVEANQIPEPARLVIGQALVVPLKGQYYIVQPGDSLWSIGQRFQVNYTTLAQANGLSPDALLMIGTSLYIPEPSKRSAEILAYVEPRGNEINEMLLDQVREANPYLTYLAVFSYEVSRDGSLKAPTINPLP